VKFRSGLILAMAATLGAGAGASAAPSDLTAEIRSSLYQLQDPKPKADPPSKGKDKPKTTGEPKLKRRKPPEAGADGPRKPPAS
jgi:hypothetical protein